MRIEVGSKLLGLAREVGVELLAHHVEQAAGCRRRPRRAAGRVQSAGVVACPRSRMSPTGWDEG